VTISFDLLSSVSQIVLINIVLSGDNAIVIALATRHLPTHQRRRAVFWGTGLAVGMRLALTLVAAYLLLVPGLRFIGAVLLVWIACQVVKEEDVSEGDHDASPTPMKTAIARIVVADLVMSFDNVLAIAGVCRAEPFRLALGLAISIAVILFFSTAILSLMNRFRWIGYAGAAVLVFAAVGMMHEDLDGLNPSVLLAAGAPTSLPHWMKWGLSGLALTTCVTSNMYQERIRGWLARLGGLLVEPFASRSS